MTKSTFLLEKLKNTEVEMNYLFENGQRNTNATIGPREVLTGFRSFRYIIFSCIEIQ